MMEGWKTGTFDSSSPNLGYGKAASEDIVFDCWSADQMATE